MRFHSLLLTAACLLLPVHAAEPPLRELLRDGLYTEEVTRDPEAAAKQYEQLLTRYAEQRDFAAAALFRLAEVRRKQDRKDDAIQLYQRLLTEFPAAANETKLARENLAAIGGKMPATAETAIDEESKELARLESLAKNAPDIILDPTTLKEAARRGWPKVIAYLLAAGSRPYASDALPCAAENGYLEIVRQLTASDAPVPADVATESIQVAIKCNRYTVLDFLLQRGFKPGKMFENYDSFGGGSALAYALLNGSPQCAEILLKHGADLNGPSDEQAGDSTSGGTALQRVIAEGKFDAANWLLEKGAKPDIPSLGYGITPLYEATLRQTDGSLALMQRLLEAGADPNRRTADLEISQTERTGLRNVTPLALAVVSPFQFTEKVRLLFKHGADPKLDGDLIRLLVQSQSGGSIECLKLLVDAGAKPDIEWLKDYMSNIRGEIRDLLIEKFTIPSFANDAEVQLVINGPSQISSTSIAVRAGDTPPPDFVRWLLANHQTINWPRNESLKYQWLSWRKGPDGISISHQLELTGNAAFPPLQWGEIVECRITMSARGSGYSSSPELPAETVAALRNHIAFPITFESDGKSRELTVRGDRVIFDPTKDELPWKNLQQLVDFFWQTPVTLETLPTIQISRKDWPDVRLSFGSKEAEKFQLEAGDRVKLEIPDKVREDMARARSLCVTLQVDGYPITKYFGSIADGKPVAASIPTLIQMLADTQCPPNSRWKKLVAIKTLDAGKLTELSYFFDGFTLLPHPDFSRIRIHRLKDGADDVLEVDLAKIIAASTDATLAADARKADITLQPGDIVEISLIKERLGEPWNGLAAQEETFFAKALSGRVTVTDDQGNISVRDLIFKSPRFIETGSGKIPVPPETGIPSLRGSWLTEDKWMSVKRGEIESAPQRVTEIFLQDGDEISTSQQQQIPRQPQPRVGESPPNQAIPSR